MFHALSAWKSLLFLGKKSSPLLDVIHKSLWKTTGAHVLFMIPVLGNNSFHFFSNLFYCINWLMYAFYFYFSITVYIQYHFVLGSCVPLPREISPEFTFQMPAAYVHCQICISSPDLKSRFIYPTAHSTFPPHCPTDISTWTWPKLDTWFSSNTCSTHKPLHISKWQFHPCNPASKPVIPKSLSLTPRIKSLAIQYDSTATAMAPIKATISFSWSACCRGSSNTEARLHLLNTIFSLIFKITHNLSCITQNKSQVLYKATHS